MYTCIFKIAFVVLHVQRVLRQFERIIKCAYICARLLQKRCVSVCVSVSVRVMYILSSVTVFLCGPPPDICYMCALSRGCVVLGIEI